MMTLYKAILLNLLLGFITIQANPVTNNDKHTTSKPNNTESGLSKGIIAVIIGLGLTTFFVVFIAYYMVRGYRLQKNEDFQETQTTEKSPSDHKAAESNLGLSKL